MDADGPVLEHLSRDECMRLMGSVAVGTDGEELRRLERIPLTPWAPGKRDHFIRISAGIVTGQRVGPG